MPTLNLGILAHVDAGKTTLTERLLYETGATRHLGRVDHGDTTTDSDSIERRRGITIRTAVATLTLPSPRGPVKVNLIDTPGHSDFVAEVERALAVLDGAVLVVSAVEGVQAQTRVIIRILERLGLPFLVFANKMDRAGAQLERTLEALREELAGAVVSVDEPVSVEEVLDAVAPWDDRLLREYVDGRPPREQQALAALAEQARLGHVHPVLSGAALAGVGISDVLAAITTYLPTVEDGGAEPLHATVFKIDRDADGHRMAYLRLHAGRLASRDHVTVHRRVPTGGVESHDARALDVRAFDRGAETRPGSAVAGDIATVVGLGEIAIGDQLGRWDAVRSGRQFLPPGLESVVLPQNPDQRISLFQALQQLSEQDPLIDARLERGGRGADGQHLRRGPEGGPGRPPRVRVRRRAPSSCPPGPCTWSGWRVWARGTPRPRWATRRWACAWVRRRWRPASTTPSARASSAATCCRRSTSPSRRRWTASWPRGSTAGGSPTSRCEWSTRASRRRRRRRASSGG